MRKTKLIYLFRSLLIIPQLDYYKISREIIFIILLLSSPRYHLIVDQAHLCLDVRVRQVINNYYNETARELS